MEIDYNGDYQGLEVGEMGKCLSKGTEFQL